MLTLKLLDDFTWTNLTTSLAAARAAKEHKMRAEMDQAKKVAGAYKEKVGKRKMLQAMQERNLKRKGPSSEEEKKESQEDKLSFDALRKRFKQRKVHHDDEPTTSTSSSALKSVMSKVTFFVLPFKKEK